MTIMMLILAAVVIVVGFFFGTALGMSWGSLPDSSPGAVVKFRGASPGSTYDFHVNHVSQNREQTEILLVRTNHNQR